MSKATRYTEEFKLAAIKQITERGHPVTESRATAGRFGAQPVCLDQALQHPSSRTTAWG